MLLTGRDCIDNTRKNEMLLQKKPAQGRT